MTNFLEGLAAGYGIAIPVGAVAILILATTMRCGFRTGFMAGAGAASADLIYASLASIAGSILSSLLDPFSLLLRIASGIVLINLAGFGLYQGLGASQKSGKKLSSCQPWRTYFQFLGITLVNPLTIVYFTAFILGRNSFTTNLTASNHITFISGAFLASLSWQTMLACLGHFAGLKLPSSFRIVAILAGNILVLLMGIRIIITALS
jgi:threonine/homoserine/homoserine lactone efflux protein